MYNVVKKVRLDKSMTRADLSAASGVAVSTLSDIERGAEPRVGTAIVLARALETTVEQLWPV